MGQGVFDLYRHLYKTEYQFIRRSKENIVSIFSTKTNLHPFCACVFGSFPDDADLKYFSSGFRDAFDPNEVELTADSFPNIFRSESITALQLGSSQLEVNYQNHGNPEIFIMDAMDSRDLMDFWNLRAFGESVLPVPVQWLRELSPFCKEIIKLNYRPLPGNDNGVMIRATVSFARSIPTANIEPLYNEFLRIDEPNSNVRRDWYPGIWRPSPGFSVRRTRPILSAGEKTFDTQLDGDKTDISFESISPDFAERYGGANARWANVIKLRDWSGKDQLATVFPCNYRSQDFIQFAPGRESTLYTTEGFVSFPAYKGMSNTWNLESGTTAIRKWLKLSGVEAELSDAGRSTEQVINTLGGFYGVQCFAHADIVKLLNKISRSPIAPSIQNHKLKNLIDQAVKGDIWRHNNFEGLVERGAVKLGLEIKCTKCGSWSWHSIKDLDDEVTCSLCLRQFNFPTIDPGSKQNSHWAYRLVGPFALPDYAKGGYAASLTIRFFSRVFGGHDRALTWSAGQILRLENADKVEADVILWHQRKTILGLDYQTELIFGEAKSFRGENADERRSIKDAFQAEDVERMKRLATRFPGAILVFATMKQASDLSHDEIDRLTKLATWGREYVREKRQTRAPVIVLTGVELFASFHLGTAWEAVGGRHAQFAQQHGRLDNLRKLADVTQQLYLGMPSYDQWMQTKWERRRQIRERRRATVDA